MQRKTRIRRETGKGAQKTGDSRKRKVLDIEFNSMLFSKIKVQISAEISARAVSV